MYVGVGAQRVRDLFK